MPEDPLAHTEDSLSSLQRRRLLAQLDLSFTTLTADQNDAVDLICSLLPVEDAPELLGQADIIDRRAIQDLLRELPQTNAVTRILNHQWPE